MNTTLYNELISQFDHDGFVQVLDELKIDGVEVDYDRRTATETIILSLDAYGKLKVLVEHLSGLLEQEEPDVIELTEEQMDGLMKLLEHLKSQR